MHWITRILFEIDCWTVLHVRHYLSPCLDIEQTLHFPTPATSSYKQCLWTVTALRPVHVNLDKEYEDNRLVQPMPDDLYESMDAVFDELPGRERILVNYYHKSKTITDGLFVVPPGPSNDAGIRLSNTMFWECVR